MPGKIGVGREADWFVWISPIGAGFSFVARAMRGELVREVVDRGLLCRLCLSQRAERRLEVNRAYAIRVLLPDVGSLVLTRFFALSSVFDPA